MKAYVLFEIKTGNVPQVVEMLHRIEGVVEAHMTFGPYDGVAVIEGDTIDEISRMIFHDIHPIPGVVDTLTCLALGT